MLAYGDVTEEKPFPNGMGCDTHLLEPVGDGLVISANGIFGGSVPPVPSLFLLSGRGSRVECEREDSGVVAAY